MELTPRFARWTTVLRPKPRLPPVTIAIFVVVPADFPAVMLHSALAVERQAYAGRSRH